jgi:hypothetical protein
MRPRRRTGSDAPVVGITASNGETLVRAKK